ncbi:Ras- protein Rab-4A [Mortierella alpina]|nr:Ras- protein Rab-4A [Mortierella alpina]
MATYVKEGATHTIGVEFGSRIVTIGKNQVKLQIVRLLFVIFVLFEHQLARMRQQFNGGDQTRITDTFSTVAPFGVLRSDGWLQWDTAGQERFRSVTRSYYRGAAGALLVYDISNRNTFTSITKWIADARKLAGADIALMLVGNKLDLEDREVSYLEASRFAQENEMTFLETSALTGDGVEETFLKCGRAILTKIETGQVDPERPGSGIQYGDSSLRRISQKNRPARQKSLCC